MRLESTSQPLTCSECGAAIEDAGYLPATDRDGRYEPIGDAAVCGDCGFNAIGMAGCAPELDDVIDPGPEDVLLYVRPTDDGLDVVSTKE